MSVAAQPTDNPLGGAGIALLVGAAALVGWLIFGRKSPVAAAAEATPATCPIDPAKLDRWGEARGFPIELLPRNDAPTLEEFLVSDLASRVSAGEQAVVVLLDGSFWYYINQPPSTGRADNLRADYCSFPDAEPPLEPPASPAGTTSGLGQVPDPEVWEFGASVFWAWNSRRQVWDRIGESSAQSCRGGFACLGTGGTARSDLQQFVGGASLYEQNWIAQVLWVYTFLPVPEGQWYLYGVQYSAPTPERSGDLPP